jgi:Glycosyl transferase family 2
MSGIDLRPYHAGDAPAAGSVPVSVVVLTRDESVNIDRCLGSLGWAQQRVVVDSGSIDDTVARAEAAGADVVVEPWRGYGAQREFTLRLPQLRHDWVYFVDADEWVSPQLAGELAGVLAAPAHEAYAQRFRLVFQGRWIRHCGWYGGAWVTRLMCRAAARFDSDLFGERVQVQGTVGRLEHDLVDEDGKGLAAWLRKHVGYAELEAARRGRPVRPAARWRAFRSGRVHDTRPLTRAVAKDLIFPAVPARPLALFCYMYLLRLGFLDGPAGLRFCLYHAWFQLTVEALRSERHLPTGNNTKGPVGERAGLTMNQTIIHSAFRPIKRVLPDRVARLIRRIAGAVLAPLLFSYRTGHFRSSLKMAAVDKDGAPIPWYSYPCIDFLKHRPYEGRVILEFGGGQSTLWWARRASRVVTLEGDRAWYERIARTMPSNVELHHVDDDNPASCAQQVQEVLQRSSYDTYDVIVIDGLWRTEMIDIAMRFVADEGMIVCDDAHGYAIQESLLRHGFHRVDFFGYSPGVVLPKVTSIYFHANSFAFSAAYAIPVP